MKWNNVELFNVDHVEIGIDGKVFLRRFPKCVMEAIGQEDNAIYGKYVSRVTTGCEIRFCGKSAAVTLSAWEADGIIEVYRGEYFHSLQRLEQGKETTLLLTENSNLDSFKPEKRGRFANNVWRIVFAHDFCGVLHHIEPICQIRPPKNEELPTKTMLAYGSSITHGAFATTFSHAYINVVAHRLGLDVLNRGMGGSCFCEKEVADYLVSEQWDFALLELGINMINVVKPEEFERRAENFIKKMCATGRKIFLLSPLPSFNDFSDKELIAEFRSAIRRINDRLQCANLMYINGEDVLTDFTGLACDLIHPSDYGHLHIGENLAKLMEGKI